MKNGFFFAGILFTLAAELAILILFMTYGTEIPQNTVAINEVLQTLESDWGSLEKHVTPTNLDYTVLDLDGTVLYRTRSGLSESIFSAVNHRDTILNIQAEDAIAGQVLIHSGEEEFLHNRKKAAVFAFAAAALLQLVLCGTYFLHIQRTVVKPFQKLKCFAERIADGCLDIPLEMDRKNLFGAFTESFDLMRSELKKAKLEAAGADAAKKELVAKLSHDIKTPVASIKAAAEVAAALAADEKTKYTYEQIIDFDFSLSSTTFVEFNLNSYDKGSKYYRVGIFGLLDSNDNLLDEVYVDHNDTLTAGWILPAGSYSLEYVSCDPGYKQTVTVGYNIVESGTSQHQMIPSDSRSFETAGNISIGGKTTLGVLFWGESLIKGEYLDGHYYKINVARKSSLDILLAGYGTTGLGIYDANQNFLQSIQTNGTSTDPDSASLRTATLNPGTYYIVVLCNGSWAFSKPYQFSVKYTPQSIGVREEQDVQRQDPEGFLGHSEDGRSDSESRPRLHGVLQGGQERRLLQGDRQGQGLLHGHQDSHVQDQPQGHEREEAQEGQAGLHGRLEEAEQGGPEANDGLPGALVAQEVHEGREGQDREGDLLRRQEVHAEGRQAQGRQEVLRPGARLQEGIRQDLLLRLVEGQGREDQEVD